ncbi:MAG: hypothetical protein OEZ33_11255, partial [Gammaproteobacteria bacterium]|nr:hypothetical protein [Gammaproteobacteria bacterium]
IPGDQGTYPRGIETPRTSKFVIFIYRFSGSTRGGRRRSLSGSREVIHTLFAFQRKNFRSKIPEKRGPELDGTGWKQ